MHNNIDMNKSGDVVGKVIVGYQAWFQCSGDGSPAKGWRHWARQKQPVCGFQSFELYPDTREYEKVYDTGYENLGNGSKAVLFSSHDGCTINTHLRWMKEYGIDGCALQRFSSELDSPEMKNIRDKAAINVKYAAEKYERKFYIMYDLSGMKESTLVEKVKNDWTKTIEGALDLIDSPAYARQNGKPVVCIWGFGFTDRTGTAEQCIELVDFFKKRGCYVIGGVPFYWRECGDDSKKNFSRAYMSFDMISPWAVGRFRYIEGADWCKTIIKQDFEFCRQHKLDYQPIAFAGFAWSNWNGGEKNMIPRLHGNFMWRQFANIRDIGIPGAYIAMFDEYDEATAIAKAAENKSMIPANQYFLTLDADGVNCSSDFYLRLTRDGAKMIRHETDLEWEHPTGHEKDD
jgi:hypothetical protein